MANEEHVKLHYLSVLDSSKDHSQRFHCSWRVDLADKGSENINTILKNLHEYNFTVVDNTVLLDWYAHSVIIMV